MLLLLLLLLLLYVCCGCCSTKYIGGHSDLIGGAISYASEEHRHVIKEHQILMGTNIVRHTYTLNGSHSKTRSLVE